MANMDKWLTVGELIKELKKFPLDFHVTTEGCDCTGKVGKVGLDTEYWEEDRTYVEKGIEVVCIERLKDDEYV
jgi:hypothetical protein